MYLNLKKSLFENVWKCFVQSLVLATCTQYGKLLAISEMCHVARPICRLPCSQVRLASGATECQYSVDNGPHLVKRILCVHQPLGLCSAEHGSHCEMEVFKTLVKH